MKRIPLLCALIASILVFNSQSHAAVIYAQNFGNAGSGNAAVSSIGWTSLWSTSSGGNVSVHNSNYYIGITNQTGRPTNIQNVNAPVSASATQGVVRLFQADYSYINTLIYTNQYTIDRSAWELDSVTWYAAGTSGGSNLESIQLALQIGGSWYVSKKTQMPALTGNAPSNFSTNAAERGIFNFESAEWYTLGAATGSPFAVGTTAITLPSGDITAFGLFVQPRQVNPSYVLFDSFVINATAVPEPGHLAAIGFLLALFCGVGRYRKNSPLA